jgi:hypothetical protein
MGTFDGVIWTADIIMEWDAARRQLDLPSG